MDRVGDRGSRAGRAGPLRGVATAVLAASPPVLLEAVAGLALVGALAGSLASAVAAPAGRDAAAVTFVVTAGGTGFLGLGSAFWGLVAGLAMTLPGRRRATALAAAPDPETAGAEPDLPGASATERR